MQGSPRSVSRGALLPLLWPGEVSDLGRAISHLESGAARKTDFQGGAAGVKSGVGEDVAKDPMLLTHVAMY